MNFTYTKIPPKTACALRKKFIDTFVDTSHDLYVKYIRDMRAVMLSFFSDHAKQERWYRYESSKSRP